MTRTALALFVVKRLMAMALLLVVLSFIVFSLTWLTPGSPVDLLLGTTRRTPEAVAEINAKYHLDDPFFSQYWRWAKGVLHGDFGTSVLTTLPVSDQLKARIPTSLFLGLYAFVIVSVVGIGAGIVRRYLERGFNGGADDHRWP